MPLSEPRVFTWWVAMILGALGILARFVHIPVLSDRIAFWLVVAGFVVLVLATLLKGV